MNLFYKKILTGSFLLASLTGKAQLTNVDIGTGTDGTDNSPIQRFYDYSSSELLFLGSEINTTGYLAGVGFYKSSGSASTTIDSVYIYAKLTNATALTVASGTAGYTPVYRGAFPNNVTSGWVSVNFNLSFLQYASTTASNLSILIVRPFQALTSARPFYRYTDNIGGNRNGWYRNSVAWSGTMNEVSGWRPNARLIFSATPLPVALGNISAANKGVVNEVKWNTYDEAKGDKFEVERSADAKQFYSLATLQANGIASSQYSFTDENPLPGKGYYRLKLLDNDGKIRYSKVVDATYTSKKGLNILVYPNPASNTLTVATEGTGKLQITNLAGQVLGLYTVGASGKLAVSISQLSAGMYLLKYTSETSNQKTVLLTKE